QNLIFHLDVIVVGELRQLRQQRLRHRRRLDGGRQLDADRRREILGRLGGLLVKLDFSVLCQQRFADRVALRFGQIELRVLLLLWHGAAATEIDSAAIVGRRRVNPNRQQRRG